MVSPKTKEVRLEKLDGCDIFDDTIRVTEKGSELILEGMLWGVPNGVGLRLIVENSPALDRDTVIEAFGNLVRDIDAAYDTEQ